MTMRTTPRKDVGFTLLELMVAVVVLLVIMVAVGRIFSTTSDISASGQAISETLQQGVAVEQQLRSDIASVSHDGFFAIRSVAVANNLHGEFLLIDDSLPPEEIIRCDQLVFFTDGVASAMSLPNTLLAGSGGTDFAGQGLASMVYYGHGVRFSELEGQGQGANDLFESDDPVLLMANPTNMTTPWYEGSVDFETRQYPNSNPQRFDVTASGFANGTQGSPSEWVLCRQAVVLADDDQSAPDADSKKSFMSRGISAHTIFPWDPRIGGNNAYPHVLHGRVDMAASQLDDIRQSVLQEVEQSSLNARFWRDSGSAVDQQELIASLFYWPRVEPNPPTAIRYDQAMMMSALAEGCVSFKIEWTYDDGVGEATDANYNWFRGYTFDQILPQPWFGDAYPANPDVGDFYTIQFDTLTSFTNDAIDGNISHLPSATIDPTIIETQFSVGEGTTVAPVPTVRAVSNRVEEYWAIFGYNGSEPFFENGLDLLNDGNSDDAYLVDDGDLAGHSSWRYTPWPSALRITMRLLDRDDRLGSGWTYQFVVDLPERKR